MRLLSAIFLAGCTGDPESSAIEDDPIPGSISVNPESLDFGTQELHSEASVWLTITNAGEGTLQIFDMAFADDSQRPHWNLDGGLSGFLEPGEETSLSVEAHPLSLTNPSTGLLIASDDPDFPEVVVPLTIEVLAFPDLRVVPAEVLEMGTVPIGEETTGDVIIANDGYTDLHVTQVSIDEDSPFTIEIDATGSTIRSRTEEGLVRVRFSPDVPGSFTETLTILTDDPETPYWSIVVQGSATD